MHTIGILAAAAVLFAPLAADGAKKKKRREPAQVGARVAMGKLRVDPLPRPSGNLEVTSANFAGEHVALNIYELDGGFNEESLERLNHAWRCRRTGTERAIDPHLFELLSLIYDRYRKPIELVSGFRNQEHTSSYHFHGSASDIRIPGVDEKELHAFVTTLDAGGLGIGRYPRAGFVHLDVRPEPSYRWVDRSPPGSSAHKRKTRKRGDA